MNELPVDEWTDLEVRFGKRNTGAAPSVAEQEAVNRMRKR